MKTLLRASWGLKSMAGATFVQSCAFLVTTDKIKVIIDTQVI